MLQTIIPLEERILEQMKELISSKPKMSEDYRNGYADGILDLFNRIKDYG